LASYLRFRLSSRRSLPPKKAWDDIFDATGCDWINPGIVGREELP
jgi:hypothetical protein